MLAPDRGERHRAPPGRTRDGSGARLRRTSRLPRSRAGGPASSPPMARQWNRIMYIAKRVNPIRWPSITPRSCTGSQMMPVSSSTSLSATSDGRVADVGPAGRVQPDPGVGPLDEQDLALVVADDHPHRDLRGDVAGHPLADRIQPLLDEVVLLPPHLERVVGGRLDVGGDLQHLLVALPLVEALGEAHARCGRSRPATRSSGRDRG